MDYAEIGHRIRLYRKLKNLSQEQLAEKINISPTHMSHIETGSTKLSLPVLVDLAQALDVQTDKLLFESKPAISEEISEILSTCNANQLDVILSVLKATKSSLNKYL
ncbi:MAG: helix-turn-helix transcriptional regulator [Treponema sp.]|nr:helix-turn-helix transcriptional regulator [Treponema sp.]